jgi:hypothetical protein
MSIDKRPTCPGGFKAAATDPEIIDLLWRDYPGPLVGVPTGERSGLTVLDIDTRRNGEAWLAEFEATHGFPRTRIHATRSGGLHFVFKHRPGLKTTVDLIAPGVEVRAEGACVVWWPASGGRVLCEGPIAPWPASLDKALASGRHRQGASCYGHVAKRGLKQTEDTIASGLHHDVLSQEEASS